jgi:aminoglycoside 6'-N-acetyltransferase
MAAYRFRPFTRADLPLIHEWRARPHVIRWWGPPEVERAEQSLLDPNRAMWIVELAGRPFAYAQDYDPHAWDPHPFAHLPPGARGIDQYIGEPDFLNQGHGSAFVRQHCDRLFAAGVTAIGTDPHPDNARAVRAYRKAGFAITGGPVETRWGRALLMERWPGRAAPA